VDFFPQEVVALVVGQMLAYIAKQKLGSNQAWQV
jgi:hypothetical protein